MANDLLRPVRQLLDRIEHATVATVSADGQPWNTPVYFARDGKFLYWTSRVDAQHSLNIRHNGRTFVVIYDSSRRDATAAGVYIEADVRELANEDAIAAALRKIYQRRKKPEPAASGFGDGALHRVYCATVVRAWTNVLHDVGECPWDERVEITLGDA